MQEFFQMPSELREQKIFSCNQICKMLNVSRYNLVKFCTLKGLEAYNPSCRQNKNVKYSVNDYIFLRQRIYE